MLGGAVSGGALCEHRAIFTGEYFESRNAQCLMHGNIIAK
jgi:hypothetical protein